MKTIYILIGQKGSGKTYIGKLIEKELHIRFFEVEPYFLNFSKDYKNIEKDSFKEVWKKIELEIIKYLEKSDKIIFESLGTFNSFKEFLKRLTKEYDIKLIKIYVSSELCIKRMQNRDNTNHVQINEKLIKKINKIAEKENYTFDIVINNEKLSDKDILNEFKKIL